MEASGGASWQRVGIPDVDELVGYPGDAEPVGVLAIAAALQVRLEGVDAPLHVDVVAVASQRLHQPALYTQGDVTSRNLWPRYNRHFVGITRHYVWS